MIDKEYNYETLNKLVEKLSRLGEIDTVMASDIDSAEQASLTVTPRGGTSGGYGLRGRGSCWETCYPYDMHHYGKRIRNVIKAFGARVIQYQSPKKMTIGHSYDPIRIEISLK